MLLASVPAIIAPVVAPIPTAAHPTDRDRGRTGNRGGPRDRAPTDHSSACTRPRPNISDSFLHRCLIGLNRGRNRLDRDPAAGHQLPA